MERTVCGWAQQGAAERQVFEPRFRPKKRTIPDSREARMAFVNEPIPEEDQKRIGWGKLRNPVIEMVLEGNTLPRWTVDRDGDAFLILLGGGSTRPEDANQPHYFLFGLRGVRIRVDALRKRGPLEPDGRRTLEWEVKCLYVPQDLSASMDEIERMLDQAFRVYGYTSYPIPDRYRSFLVDFSSTLIEREGKHWQEVMTALNGGHETTVNNY
jgi:hypothetical protein